MGDDIGIGDARRWFSGRMLACHAGGPGSIPGRRTRLFVTNICELQSPTSSKTRSAGPKIDNYLVYHLQCSQFCSLTCPLNSQTFVNQFTSPAHTIQPTIRTISVLGSKCDHSSIPLIHHTMCLPNKFVFHTSNNYDLSSQLPFSQTNQCCA